MKTFTCDICGQLLFFENVRCIRCDHSVGYAPDQRLIRTLVPDSEQDGEAVTYSTATRPGGPGTERKYGLCQNSIEYNACNWLVRSDEAEVYCRACRLTEILPALVDEVARKRWVRVETAKRRLLYTLDLLGLPAEPRSQSEHGLAFRFQATTPRENVVTGHADGVITLNIAEADDAFRENAREKLGEAYRTVLGHLRHEIGHYYWDRFIRDSDAWLPRVRQLFGDERESYQAAVTRHYAEGPPASWPASFISAYATMHPWEDWAETFAHYLHMVDTLETARSYDMSMTSPTVEGEPGRLNMEFLGEEIPFQDFRELFNRWYSLTFVLNGLSRSMGMPDTYPFAVSNAVRDKLELVHQVITTQRTMSSP